MGCPSKELTVKLKKEVLSITDILLVDVSSAAGRATIWPASKQATSSGKHAMPRSSEDVLFKPS